MNRRWQGALAVLTVFMSCLLMAYLAVITSHHNGLALFTRHHESGHSDDNDSWSGSGMWEGSELYPTPTPVLNPTCQALEQLAATSGICTTSDQCTGVNCVTGFGSFDISVEPCHNPPAVHVVGRGPLGGLIVNETLTQSRQQDLLGIGALNINIQQSPNEDSISISVTVAVLGAAPVTIIPETTIPLNRAQCPHTTQPTTTRTSTSLRMPSPTPRANETCESLQQLASSSQLCVTNSQCSGLHCELPGSTGSFDITVEPCHNPPAVHVVGTDALGGLIVNETLTQSRQQDLLGIGTLNINIQQSPNEDSISIRVTVAVLGGAPVTIIPETTIPLNRAQCPHTTQPTTTRTSTPLRMPSPTPRANETCESLQQLASSSQLCVTNSQCSGLHCELPGSTGSFDITVEPCRNPPAVHVVSRDALGGLIVNETLTQSRQQDLLGIGTLNINIQQSPNEDSISINVTVAVFGAAPVTIIPEATIPLNRAQCPHTTQPTTTRTSTPLRMPSPTPRASKTSALFQLSMTQSLLAVSSSRPPMGTFYTAASVTSTSSSIMVSPPKLPAGAGQSITVAVAVPVTVLLVSIGGVVLLVSIVMAIRRHRRFRREYHFQQMTFNTDNDDDDDDNDL